MASSPRPLSIKLIALWYLIASAVTLCHVASDALVFGFYVSGSWAVIHNLILLPFLLGLGVGLWLLRDVVRRVAIGYQGYVLLCEVLVVVLPSSRAKVLALINQMSAEAPLTADIAATLTAVPGILFAALIIWLLVTRKSSFS